MLLPWHKLAACSSTLTGAHSPFLKLWKTPSICPDPKHLPLPQEDGAEDREADSKVAAILEM